MRILLLLFVCALVRYAQGGQSFIFKNPSGIGDWDSATNWFILQNGQLVSAGRTPEPFDDATLDNQTATLQSAATVTTLYLKNGGRISGGVLTVDTLRMESSDSGAATQLIDCDITVRVSGEVSGNNNSFNGVGLRNSGTFRVHMPNTGSGGTISFVGNSTEIINEAKIILVGALANSGSRATLRNNGTLEGTGSLRRMEVVNSGTIKGQLRFSSCEIENRSTVDSSFGVLSLDGCTVNLERGSRLTGGYFFDPSRADGIHVSGSTVHVNADVPVEHLFLIDSTLDGPGDIRIGKGFIWMGGTIGGEGTFWLEASAQAAFEFGCVLRRDLINAGRVTWISGSITVTPEGSFTTDDGGTLTIDGSREVTVRSLGGGKFVNHGTLRKMGTNRVAVAAFFENSGSVKLENGSMSVGPGATVPGGGTARPTFELAAGTELVFGAGTFTLNATVLTGEGYASLRETGILEVNGANAADRFELIDGQVTLNGSLRAQKVLTWRGGIVSGKGSLEVSPGANLIFSRVGLIKRLREATISIAGDATWEGDPIEMANGARLVITSSGRFFIEADNSINAFDPPPQIQNNGKIIRQRTQGVANIQPELLNDAAALVSVQSGTLAISGGRTSGTLEMNPGTLEFFGRPHTLANARLIGSGVARVIPGGTVVIEGRVPATQLELAGGTITGPGTLVLEMGMRWSEGTKSGPGTVMNAGSSVMTIAGPNPKRLREGHIINQGTANWSDKGNIEMTSGTTFVNEGMLNVTNDGAVLWFGPERPKFINQGTLRKTGGANATVFQVDFIHTGILAVSGLLLQQFAARQEPQLNFAGHASLQGAFRLTDTSTLRPPPGTRFIVAKLSSHDGEFKGLEGVYLGTGNSLRPVFTAGTFELESVTESFFAPDLAFQPQVVNGEIRLAWPSFPGQSFEIQVSEDLQQWQTVFSGVATDRETAYPVVLLPPPERRFYRIKVN